MSQCGTIKQRTSVNKQAQANNKRGTQRTMVLLVGTSEHSQKFSEASIKSVDLGPHSER